MPAQAGIQGSGIKRIAVLNALDSRLRGNDGLSGDA
jgi:hypothetical protein